MICPDCKFDNMPGADFCESCGNDLGALDHPRAEDEFTGHLLNDRLGDIVAHEAHVVAPTDPVAWAIALMQRGGQGCVVVKSGDRLAGILTERDVLLKAAGERVDLNAVTVGQLMSKDPVVLHEEDSLAVALHKMSIGGFRHIPLEKNGRVTSVVSIRDLFHHISAFIHKQPIGAS